MPLEGFLFYLSVVLVGAFLIAGLEWIITRAQDKALGRPREDNRLPRREYELLGEDWRDCLRRSR